MKVLGKTKELEKTSVSSDDYEQFKFITSFNHLAFLIPLHLNTFVLTTLMTVNLFALSVNVFLNSCNVLYICK